MFPARVTQLPCAFPKRVWPCASAGRAFKEIDLSHTLSSSALSLILAILTPVVRFTLARLPAPPTSEATLSVGASLASFPSQTPSLAVDPSVWLTLTVSMGTFVASKSVLNDQIPALQTHAGQGLFPFNKGIPALVSALRELLETPTLAVYGELSGRHKICPE